ncbi:unnamed protein product [Paramecium sonneborni]|uniref:Cyclic nucleotide-binding domain-containing protein n=1 Tax=Paramecium sonneborni TaxID=65129 RepID=A0A8S1PTV6_9CILI|nr:unnamed protein product [Paramecium sonneborni]
MIWKIQQKRITILQVLKLMVFLSRVITKPQDLRERIDNKISGVFLFQALDQNEKNIIIYTMEEKHFNLEDWIIHQEDALYVVVDGQLDFYRTQGSRTEANQIILSLLSLHHLIQQRFRLICLDRSTSNAIVQEATVKRMEYDEEVLFKVEILNLLVLMNKLKYEMAFQSSRIYYQRRREERYRFYIVKGTLIVFQSNEDVLSLVIILVNWFLLINTKTSCCFSQSKIVQLYILIINSLLDLQDPLKIF